MAKAAKAAAALLLVAALLLLGPCDGRELKGSGGEASGGGVVGEEKQATGLPLIPTLPPVLGPGVQLPPVPGVPGLPPGSQDRQQVAVTTRALHHGPFLHLQLLVSCV